MSQMHVVIAELGRYPLPAETSGKFADDDNDDDDESDASDVSDAADGAETAADADAEEWRRRLKAERRQFRRRKEAARSMGDLIADMAGGGRRRLETNIEEEGEEEVEEEELGAAGGATLGRIKSKILSFMVDMSNAHWFRKASYPDICFIRFSLHGHYSFY